jgi:hypothetical protein
MGFHVTDEILWQEIYSLREKLNILTKIVSYYEPDIDFGKFLHDLGTCDFDEYLDYICSMESENMIKNVETTGVAGADGGGEIDRLDTDKSIELIQQGERLRLAAPHLRRSLVCAMAFNNFNELQAAALSVIRFMEGDDKALKKQEAASASKLASLARDTLAMCYRSGVFIQEHITENELQAFEDRLKAALSKEVLS